MTIINNSLIEVKSISSYLRSITCENEREAAEGYIRENFLAPPDKKTRRSYGWNLTFTYSFEKGKPFHKVVTGGCWFTEVDVGILEYLLGNRACWFASNWRKENHCDYSDGLFFFKEKKLYFLKGNGKIKSFETSGIHFLPIRNESKTCNISYVFDKMELGVDRDEIQSFSNIGLNKPLFDFGENADFLDL